VGAGPHWLAAAAAIDLSRFAREAQRAPSRRRRAHPGGDLRAALALDGGEIVLALEIEPELAAIAE
jgi:hypothetical protein